MRTIAPSVYTLCLPVKSYNACVYCLHECLRRLCNDVRPYGRWRHQAPAAMPERLLCTFPSSSASSIPGPGAAGLQVWP